MSRRKSPAYQWYPSDYLGCEHVQQMTLEAEGAYRRLLDHQWLNGTIPNDIRALARICRNIRPTRMQKLWVMIEPCFVPTDPPTALVNRRLERVRREREAYTEERAESGRKGGLQRVSNASLDRSVANSGDSSRAKLPGLFIARDDRANRQSVGVATVERAAAPAAARDLVKLSLESDQAHLNPPSPSPSPSPSPTKSSSNEAQIASTRRERVVENSQPQQQTASTPEKDSVPPREEEGEFTGWYAWLQAARECHGKLPDRWDLSAEREAYIHHRRRGESHAALLALLVSGLATREVA
jgi:uncharacterized protein YdaU (DUF1376 family)